MTSTEVAADGFFTAVLAHPDRPALIGPGELGFGERRRVTFGELRARANQVSNGLRDLGLVRGDVVAAMVRNDSTYFELVLATGQIGLYLVPINTHLAPAEAAYIVRDSDAKVLVAHADLAAELGPLVQHRFAVAGEAPGWSSYEGFGGSAEDPADRSSGVIMGYTSGTTGRPRGVKRPLPDLTPERLAAMTTGLSRMSGLVSGEGTHLVTSPLYHAAPGSYAMSALHLGHTVVVHERFDAEATLRDIERYRVTSSHMVPTHFHRMLRLPAAVRERYDLSSLRTLVHAGAPCPVEVKRQMIEWVGPILWEYLGATEGMVSTVGSPEWLARPGTVGRPFPGFVVKLLDDTGAEVPVGEAGTIYFGGSGTFEYHNDPDKTRAGRAHGLPTVGDIGRFDEDGYLYLLDRRTDLILSGGVNIYSAEIEQHLITHPSVSDVAVIGVPDPEWGQSVLAMVQPADPAMVGEDLADELAAYCKDGLASYKRPRRYEFRSDFPRSAAGKLLRRELRDEYGR
ncbi:AMP-binding protein [Nonomuraea sp. NPDC048901]|uniref:AMP-binding protein n=1 Tax=Nonomuraea sp. NPDC048901 TaxID=3155627 RepID=UPI0033D3894E